MKSFYLSAFLFLSVTFVFSLTDSYAQTYRLSGYVTDNADQPLEDAEIFVTDSLKTNQADLPVSIYSNTSLIGRTDNRGYYEIDSLGTGTYYVTALYIGKRSESKKIRISDRDLSLDFKLSLLQETLNEITIGDQNESSLGVSRLRPVEGSAIYDAKKNEVINFENVTANLATNNSRQIYGKIAGLNIWESDGAGVQLGLGGRGLSPNRNSNFNTRQNGYDISADALGYPESYYTPPSQALDRVEIIRGASSLQYGTQFGGVVNFVFKEGTRRKPFQLTTVQSGGANGLFTSFNSAGGTVGKMNYYAFYQYKRSDGWRPNSNLDQHTAFGSFKFEVTPEFTVQAEYTFMNYLQQQPGGLTDAQFEQDPSQSTRERNWFSVNWNLFSAIADYKFSSRTNINTRFFGLIASRDALGNLGRIDRIDFGGNRDLLRDRFRNWGNETRLLHRYSFLNNISALLVGTRFYDGFTVRREGDGSDGSDPDFNFDDPNRLDSDFDLPSKNISVFTENVFNVTNKFSITPGVRFEYIKTESDGFFREVTEDLAGNILVDDVIPEERRDERSFVFFGVGMSYKESNALELYWNFSQNYRAVNFNDIRVDIGSLEVDPDIRDERGFNVDLGARGNVSNILNYDVTLFHLSYKDRIGSILRREPDPRFNNLIERTFRFRTNVADANIYGFEGFFEVDMFKLFVDSLSPVKLSLFTNISFISAEYTNSDENGIEGNEVELVPPVNFKTGLNFGKGNFESSYQFTYVSEHFSDATNARRTPTAIEGIIPSYHVMDVSFKYSLGRYSLETGVNNLTDNKFFTRRATGYPGPGIIPAEARSFYLTVGARF
ncbi:MAG TPA: TonB-dependent receptor [Balneolaceae bacterium]|nr:TonB-dependent receptor [Balneolaceae bacterium]